MLTLSTDAEYWNVPALDLADQTLSLLYRAGHYDVIYPKRYVRVYPVLMQYNKSAEFLDDCSDSAIETYPLERIPEELEESSEIFGSKVANSARHSSVAAAKLASKAHEKVSIGENKWDWKCVLLVIGIVLLTIMTVILSQRYINSIKLPELREFEHQNNPKFYILKRKANQ